ncbi:unnamed protein product [Candidula unifasciata]|uniref:Spermatogenesis-associated protein 7 n=1 Tax=Candidula unifasciata TaxID=100452 RepID=A0A8S4A3J2_9EUPU|nr:unnamed protein product [Candidula unifasciata]
MSNYSKDTINIIEKGRIQNKKQKSQFQPPQRNNSPQKVSENPGYDLEEKGGTAKLSSSMLMDMSIRSRDEACSQETINGVPPLAITVDKDHMNWLQEQASKAEVRVRSSGRLKSSLHPDEELHSVRRYRSPGSDTETDNRMEKQRKDEEQKYLAFAKEVTDDVLSRGISSDSVLDKVFENHIVRRKDDLDEDRMRKVISDLRKNLGFKDSVSRGQVSSSVSDSNYSNKYKREHTTDNSSRNRGSNHVNSDLDVNSTFESVNTLKFGQTGDVLSTINSEASLEKKEIEKRLHDDNEMALSQTLRDYQLSLTDKEDIDNSLKDSQHNTGVQENALKHSYGQLKPAINERKISREGERRAEVSSNQQTSNIDKSLGTSPENSHVTNDEDTSVSSSVLSQRPVARPRAKARQGRHERTRAAVAAAAAGEDEEVTQGQQDDAQNTTAGGLKNHNSPVAGTRDTTDSDATQPGNAEESASETAKQETDHQQAVEEMMSMKMIMKKL